MFLIKFCDFCGEEIKELTSGSVIIFCPKCLGSKFSNIKPMNKRISGERRQKYAIEIIGEDSIEKIEDRRQWKDRRKKDQP